jgi:hypothetical protein
VTAPLALRKRELTGRCAADSSVRVPPLSLRLFPLPLPCGQPRSLCVRDQSDGGEG